MKKILLILICLLLCGCQEELSVDINSINNFNYEDTKQLDFDLHSNEYMLVRVNDLKVLYEKDADKIIYPASLTKLMTLDTVLNYANSLDETSYITYNQVQDLIAEDASIAYIQTDYDYSLRDLLYALILPSGADGAIALENYFTKKGTNLIEEMKKQLDKLGCTNTSFVNTTGLHDDSHHTTLNDLLKIVMDILSFDEGRQILETTKYITEDGIRLQSSLRFIQDDKAILLGGKTGYTPESGQSVIVLYKANNRSYILLLANAMGDPLLDQHYNYDDAMELMDKLY